MTEKLKSGGLNVTWKETLEENRIRPHRNWNTEDFYGKYHLSRFENKLTPLPGTQVKLEHDYQHAVEDHSANFYDTIDANTKARKKHLDFQCESVALRTKLFFDTVIHEPIRQAESLLYQREEELNRSFEARDPPKAIKKWFQSMQEGRHHYVGYSIAAGFKSINHRHPETGDTGLHLAARNGHPMAVEELLKYKAAPDTKNNYGYHAVHQSWMFWKTHFNRTKEERIEQEEKTCAILLNLFSYGAYVDATDLSGQSPLHIACRLGPLAAVKIILSFKADYLLEYNGQLPQEIARKHGHEEIAKLVEAWGLVRQHLLNFDFSIVWKKFLEDELAVISSSKSAEQILLEIEMHGNIRKLERDNVEGVAVDDPLLQSAYKAANAVTNKKVPKPWEAGWAEFVRASNQEGVTSLKQQLEALTQTQQKQKKTTEVKIRKENAVLPRSRFPDKSAPDPRPRRLAAIKAIEAEALSDHQRHHCYGQANQSTSANNDKKNDGGPPSVLDQIIFATGDMTTSGAVDGKNEEKGEGEEVKEEEEEEEEGEDEDAIKKRIAVHWEDDFEDDEDESTINADEIFDPYFMKKKKTKAFSKSGTLAQRRHQVAMGMANDAKFLKFTRKPSLASGMLLAQRTPTAPMLGTEEEGSVLRMLVSQGKEYEKADAMNKSSSKYAQLLGISKNKKPKITTMGHYSEFVKLMQPNMRDQLYSSVVMDKESDIAMNKFSAAAGSGAAGASEEDKDQGGDAPTLEGLKKLEGEKRSKIDMVGGVRPRYVKAELLPPTREKSMVESATAARHKKAVEAFRKKNKLGDSHVSDARLSMEKAVAEAAAAASSATSEDDIVGGDSPKKEAVDDGRFTGAATKNAASRAAAMSRWFLKAEAPKYGAGRITSTHNMKGKIEAPWSTTGGRAKTIPGDRTA